jgi:integrase
MTKMTKRRDHGDGGIDERGENVFRLRYRLDGKRYTTTFHGSRADAKKELRRLVRSGDVGEHIAPDKIRLADWIDRWLALLERRQDGAESEQPRERRRGIVKPHHRHRR